MSARSIVTLSALVAISACAVAPQRAHAALVHFDAAPAQPLAIGDSFSLTLRGDDFLSTLDGGGVDLTFNSSVLRLTSVAVDTTVWDFYANDGVIDNAAGTLSDVWFASFEQRIGSFSIAQFTFEALGAGLSALTLTENPFNPFASGGELLPVEFGSLSIQVASTPPPDPDPVTVPLPSTLLLWLCGLPLMALARRSVN